MTFKQLLDKYDYEAIVPYVRLEVENNEYDLRPLDVRMQEMADYYAEMKKTKPTFGYIETPIEVKCVGDKLIVSNMHLGAMSDLLSHRVDVSDGVKVSEAEILALCVFQLVAHQPSTEKYREDDDFCTPGSFNCVNR